MNHLPPALLDRVPTLGLQIKAARRLCLLFNWDYLESLRGDSARVKRLIQWLCPRQNLVLGVVSCSSLAQLQVKFGNTPLILAAENGYLIEGPEFAWAYPELKAIRESLERIYNALRTEYPELLNNGGCSYSLPELWLRILVPQAQLARQVVAFCEGYLDNRLVLAYQNGVIQIEPQNKWDRLQTIEKVLQYTLPPNPSFPGILYFGGDSEDEQIFSPLARYGWSIIVRNRPPLSTRADFYLRGIDELYKFLYWLYAS